ncbi:MAG: LysR family transcriptional regulator [bacterium]|nr:LysR family transcriptional regulator [bacterium]MDY4634973.1 LysR family transcriptional regulator [Candidatus Limivicinus sp.]MDY5565094.1 LysR family transcriptional regulator [Candidatus Limivicinus sp.]
MDAKKVQALLAAVDLGSLTSAASELGYTQSGLTHMMNSLETELGLTLLLRGKSGVRLSPAGQELLPELRSLADAADALDLAAEQLRQRNCSTLRLGAYSSIARHWVPQIMAEYRKVCPDTQVSLIMDGLVELYSAVRDDQLDCIMTSYDESLAQGFGWIPLWEDELVAVLPESFPLEGDVMPVERFDESQFLMPSQGADTYILPIFAASPRKIGPHIITTNLDDESIVSMVEHGLGVSLLSRLVVKGMSYQVKIVPISPKYFRSLGIIVSEKRMHDKNIRRLISCSQSIITAKYGSQTL